SAVRQRRRHGRHPEHGRLRDAGSGLHERYVRTGLRLLLAALWVGVVAASGCGDDTTSATTKDMSIVASDQAVAVDLSTLTCNNILNCVSNCGDNAGCQLACRQA